MCNVVAQCAPAPDMNFNACTAFEEVDMHLVYSCEINMWCAMLHILLCWGVEPSAKSTHTWQHYVVLLLIGMQFSHRMPPRSTFTHVEHGMCNACAQWASAPRTEFNACIAFKEVDVHNAFGCEIHLWNAIVHRFWCGGTGLSAKSAQT